MAPMYTFRSPSGEETERFFPISEAPRIGEMASIDGMEYKRVVDHIQIRVKDVNFASHSLSRNHPDAPRVDEKGKPCFQSQREVDEFVAKQEGAIVWD